MSLERTAANTTCAKGHVHGPWNTTGILRIAKCESVCGFCKKETKTAANLRKHVAIHIKNEGLNLTIAEGSSGRGRLEMQPAPQIEASSSSSRFSNADDSVSEAESINSSNKSYTRTLPPPRTTGESSFSPSAVLLSMASRSYPPPHSLPYPSTSLTAYSPHIGGAVGMPQTLTHSAHNPSHHQDPFRALRDHNIRTKTAWTVIPASEGSRILDLCKSLSVAQNGDPRPSSEGRTRIGRVPCYNRETLFDEEWQAHMKDVHGVFLLWPETWMRRIEVLDLDPFGGDIGACNEVIMEN